MDVTVHKGMPIMKCLGEDLKDQTPFIIGLLARL